MNKPSLSYIATVLLVIFLLGTIIVQAQNPTSTTFLQPGSLTDQASYTVWLDGGNYFSRDGETGQVTTSTNKTTMQQAAIDNTAYGVVYLKNMTIDNDVVLKDGVVVIAEWGGYLTYYISNPLVEYPVVTNYHNIGIFNIISYPTNDPPTEDGHAWSAFTAEIIEPVGGTEFYAAGYFGAKALNGSSGDIWGLNPLVQLDGGSGGNALGIEVDVNNLQQDDVGSGILVTLGDPSTYDGNYGILINSQSATLKKWNVGLSVENCKTYGVVVIDANDQALRYYNASGDANPMMSLQSGALYFGAGAALDTGFLRGAAGELMTSDTTISAVMSADTDEMFRGYVTGDGNIRWSVNAKGEIWWGDGTNARDTVLYRGIANQLVTNDQFYAQDGTVLVEVAGNVTDAAFLIDTNGLIAIDATNGRIYVRYGGNWHYAALDEGFQIPVEENHCPICGKLIGVDDFVVGQINKLMDDGAPHGLWVHLSCALESD